VSWRAWGAFAALGIIWGLPYFFIKLSVQELSPVVVAFGRVMLAALILLPIAWRRGALRSLGKHKAAICAFALAEFVIPFSIISFGERWISSSVTGILIAMVPLSIALIQRFFGVHERLGVWRILGLGLGFVGVAALLTFPTQMPSMLALTSMAILGVACTALAMLLMFYLVGHAGASRAAVITYINPAVAALLGVWLLHERLGLGGILAFVLILLGSWLATRATGMQHQRAGEAIV
jgi:drug/metabolite transporter (DMT)-like permease